MKHHKNLLKLNDLAAFREYLTGPCGLECRDGKGEFEVLQVKIDKACWAPVNRNAQGQLSTHPELRPLIMGFYKTGKAAPRQAEQAKPAPAKRDAFLDDLRDDFAISALGMLAHRYGRHESGMTAEAVAVASYELADAMLEARNAKPAPKKSDTWPKHWKQDGYNGCMVSAAKALRYLANNERPIGGEQTFNAEHLFQIAGELETTKAELLAP